MLAEKFQPSLASETDPVAPGPNKMLSVVGEIYSRCAARDREPHWWKSLHWTKGESFTVATEGKYCFLRILFPHALGIITWHLLRYRAPAPERLSTKADLFNLKREQGIFQAFLENFNPQPSPNSNLQQYNELKAVPHSFYCCVFWSSGWNPLSPSSKPWVLDILQYKYTVVRMLMVTIRKQFSK